jgi:hypothetical protein
MRMVLRTIAALLGGLGVLSGVAPSASAQSTTNPPPNPSISLKPDRGLAGSTFTISWSNFTDRYQSRCKGGITFDWNTNKTPLGESEFYPPVSGSISVKVPQNAGPGTHTVIATCRILEITREATFTVTQPTTSTTTTTTSPPFTPPVIPPVIPPGNPPVITPPVRNPPSTTTRRRPPVTTTTPPGTSLPPPPVTTELPPLSTADPRPTSDGNLILDRNIVGPGESLSASGEGCTPGAPVTLMVKGERVGGTVADANGAFSAPISFKRIEAGRHWVTTDCGVKLTAAVDQMLTSSTGGQSSTMIILVFFVLAGIALIRFR